MNPIVAFWFAYIVTRPLGASFADGFSKPTNGGLNLGDGTVSAIALVVFVALVAYVCRGERNVRATSAGTAGITLPTSSWTSSRFSPARLIEPPGDTRPACLLALWARRRERVCRAGHDARRNPDAAKRPKIP